MASMVSKWFGKKQRQVKRRFIPDGAQTIYQSYVQTPGKPVWTPREYHKFAEEAYTRNVITHRAIGMIAQGAAGVPWLLYNGKGDARQEVKAHPILSLLKNPNPTMNGSQFIENLITYRMISGNAYVLAIGPADGPPMELHLLRPDRVQVIAGRNGQPMGYQYETDDNIQYYMMHPVTGQGNILHLKTFNPLNDWYGLSPIEAAAYSIDQHNKDLATPPGSPAAGDVYIIAASPTGAWSGKAGYITYYNQAWQFIAPKEGMQLWVRDEDKFYIYNGSAWVTASLVEYIAGRIDTAANKDYTLVVDMPYAATITQTTTQCASGTCTATFKINTTALGGTANAVSSTKQSQTQSSANVVAAGNAIVMTVSSNASCVDLAYRIAYTRAL